MKQAPYQQQARRLTLAAVGDALVTQSLLGFNEPEYQAMLEHLRAADVAFVNLEGVVRQHEGSPQAESGGTWVSIPPASVAELKGLGFNLFATAQNHTLDWGEGGLLAMFDYLDAVGVTHAGSGRNLAEARRPAYLDHPQGRVALLATSTTFHNWNRAGDARPDCVGRPGLNPLRVKRSLEVDADTFAALERLNDTLKLDAKQQLRVKLGFAKASPEGSLLFEGQTVRRADRNALKLELHEGDLRAILHKVREAKRQADWVVMSVHCHEMGDGELETPPEFLRTFARACVDAGADTVIGHGPHLLRGIEIYAGKPIFYSLGNFIFQNETLPYQPSDFFEGQGLVASDGPADAFDARSAGGGFTRDARYWQSILAICRWEAGRLEQVQLHPLTLGHGLPRAVRGRPMLAAPDEGRAIIATLAALSAPFGSSIGWDERAACGILTPTPSD